MPRGPGADLSAGLHRSLGPVFSLPVLLLWSSSPFNLRTDHTVSQEPWQPHSLYSRFAAAPQPGPCLYLRGPNGPCFLASYIRLHLYCRCVYRIPRLDQHSLVSCVVSPVGGTGTLPCRGAELDGRGTSTHGAGSAGDAVSEEMWC